MSGKLLKIGGDLQSILSKVSSIIINENEKLTKLTNEIEAIRILRYESTGSVTKTVTDRDSELLLLFENIDDLIKRLDHDEALKTKLKELAVNIDSITNPRTPPPSDASSEGSPIPLPPPSSPSAPPSSQPSSPHSPPN